MMSPGELTGSWRIAYNSLDLNALYRILHPKIALVHHGHGPLTIGRDAVLERLAAAAQGPFPGRCFSEPRRITISGDIAVVEYDWQAEAVRNVEGIARAGESVTIRICAVVITRDNRIVEYTEYG
ncbi:nuclear transport factor 2 family protein [Leucobacter sp. Z1108]|uniref:nuclear transport factor 2 family protein n=1 Tax=Leucobacter sp. Z1108 TaxID=3439066 RepID=UPI003F3BA35B